MKYQAVVHRRFSDNGSAPYLYVSNSASILRLDDTSDELLSAFEDAADPGVWLAERQERSDHEDLRTTFTNMVGLGARIDLRSGTYTTTFIADPGFNCPRYFDRT